MACLLLASAHQLAAQNAQAAIEQARLYGQTPTPVRPAAPNEATAISPPDESSDDDSLGAQVILRTSEPVRRFILTADGSIFYTSNAALSRHNRVDDGFAVFNAGGAWMSDLGHDLQLQLSLRASTFRYFHFPSLDFVSFGTGVGLGWTPRSLPGVAAFLRYDFTELLDNGGDSVLSDNQWSIGAQKLFPLGRSQALTVGVAGSVGVAAPFSAQRDELGAFVGYQFRISRSLVTDLSYRFGVNIYASGSRVDRLHVLAWDLRYRINSAFDGGIFVTAAENRSNRSSANYRVASPGGGAGFTWRF